MKTKIKKALFGLGVALLGNFTAQAQTGLEGIRVEKYYQSDINDYNNSINTGAVSPLNVGSITYRVYVDMAAGWRINAVFGNPGHDLKVNTTTVFYNDPNNGVKDNPQNTSVTNTKKNTVLVDSWWTMGGVATGKLGVLKIEDNDGSLGNTNNVLLNNPGGAFGAPINSITPNPNAKDGMINGAPASAVIVGFSPTVAIPGDAIFDQTPGGQFLTNNGSIAVLGGVVGTTTTNAVLIGQFTTDGTLGFELNIQLQNVSNGTVEYWVAKNPQPGEFTDPSLSLAPPTVTITAPANNVNVITGSTVNIAASASANGTVSSVQFFVDGSSVGTDVAAPFTATYAATTGQHTLTALATDNNGLTATSSAVLINVAPNQVPVVSVSAPSGLKTGDLATFTATATDADGTVTAVSFSVNGSAIGTTTTSPYTATWTALFGSNQVARASATDDQGAVGLSAPVQFNVVNNIPPAVSITAPLNNSSVIAPQVVTITATANDPDGSITLVEAFVNNASIGSFTTAGPNYTFTYATSTLSAVDVIKVVATDNSATTTTSSPVNVTVANPNALPYEIGKIKQQCNQGTFCLPISAALTYTVDNVIGFDITLNYDAAKVTPTGSITVNPGVITPSFVTVINAFSNGTMNISAYFNGNAPGNAEFNGTGDIFCVGFVKNTMNSIDTAVYTIADLQESYFTGVVGKSASAGRYSTYRDTTFSAELRFWNGRTPLSYDISNPNTYLITNIYGSSNACVINTVAVQPDLNGNFVYNILNGSSISIQRDILAPTIVQPAINSGDRIIGNSILLNTATGTLTPSVYQMIALDVNIDGVVSAGDLSQLNQRSVNFIPEFKQAWNYNASGVSNGQLSKDWIFIDSVRIMNDPAYSISATFPLNDNLGYSKARVPVTPFCLTVPQTSLSFCPTINDET